MDVVGRALGRRRATARCALERRVVARGRRSGERARGPSGGDVVDRAPAPGRGRRRAGPRRCAATRSTWPSSATRWFEAITAAAWYAARCVVGDLDRPPAQRVDDARGTTGRPRPRTCAPRRSRRPRSRRRQRDERMDRAAPSVGAEDVEPERAGHVRDHRVGRARPSRRPRPPRRRARRAARASTPRAARRHVVVATGGSRRPTRRRPAHERTRRPPGPDRGCAPTGSATPSACAAGRHSSGSTGHDPARRPGRCRSAVTSSGREVAQRREHEPPLLPPGMRDREVGRRPRSTPSIHTMSTSSVRGPHRSPRTRFGAASIRWHTPSSCMRRPGRCRARRRGSGTGPGRGPPTGSVS